MAKSKCRNCSFPLTRIFADLGVSPLANSYLTDEQLHKMEPFYPLCAYVCEACLLVQLEEFETPEAIFSDYAYFSSFSTSWLDHARQYVQNIATRLQLGSASKVVEIASNDGYLLQYFLAKGIPVLGIEPAANVAEAAIAKGIPTRVEFFGRDSAAALANEGKADLIVGNNVFAHVPDLHSFVEGIRRLLKPDGVVTLEFPHLLRLMSDIQFDTIYHEHFSYFSLIAVEEIFSRFGLAVFDVDELTTHGGSLRVYGKHVASTAHTQSGKVLALRRSEESACLHSLDTYSGFGDRVSEVKCGLLEFLIDCRRKGKSVAGYGAPAKGNTLLNYCGVGPDLLAYTVDRSPHKQGLYLPGSRIPIYGPEKIYETRPDYVLILPWNLKDEISQQMSQIRDWGGRFAVPIPAVHIF